MGLKKYSLLLLLFAFASCQTQDKMQRLQGDALGTSYNIKYTSDVSEKELRKGIDSLLYHLNKSLSTYLPNSDISKINRGDTTLVVDKYFREVFKKASEVWKATAGYFDPTVGAFVNAYGFGPKKKLNILNRISKLKMVNTLKSETNSLESVIISRFPIIKIVLKELSLLKKCEFSRITGSGSACFGLFLNKKDALLGLKLIKKRFPKFWCVLSRTI